MRWSELIGWIHYDREECIGPERVERLTAIHAAMSAAAFGAKIDVYDVLEMLPWNKLERPMLSTDEIEKQITIKAGAFLRDRENKKNG